MNWKGSIHGIRAELKGLEFYLNGVLKFAFSSPQKARNYFKDVFKIEIDEKVTAS